MTRTGAAATGSHAWESRSFVVSDDGSRIDHTAAGQDAVRPKGRIRRSMTACNTCRKLKTRCDLDPRGHACRRCLSLRYVLALFPLAHTYPSSVGVSFFANWQITSQRITP